MIYRRATQADIPAILDLAVESVSQDPLPVKIDRSAMAETARTLPNPGRRRGGRMRAAGLLV